jgi:tetratricopeptide (TPR) repeat protein
VPGLVVHVAVLTGLLLARTEPLGGALVDPPHPFLHRRGRALQAACLVLGLVAAAGVARHGLGYLAAQRAGTLRDAGQLAAARAWLARAARLVPDSAGHQDALAAAALRAWRADHHPADRAQVEAHLLRALALDSGDARRYARLASVYRELAHGAGELRGTLLERARRLYEEAERLDPYAVAYPVGRAEVLALLDDARGARAALERAAALEPRFLPGRLRLARLLAAMGDREAALAHYEAIEAAFQWYESSRGTGAGSPFAGAYLAVDRVATRREAQSLAERGR